MPPKETPLPEESWPRVEDMSPTQRAEMEARFAEFKARRDAIPLSERVVITNPKFDGPIGRTITDDNADEATQDSKGVGSRDAGE